jgi:quercetin dioxygenase-like cupin family protein
MKGRTIVKIEETPYTTVDWSKVPATEHRGETGVAHWQTVEQGNVRVRMVGYSPGYLADHWCARGHIILVLEGEMVNELKDGRQTVLSAGMGYHVQDDEKNPHRTSSRAGARLFIVD